MASARGSPDPTIAKVGLALGDQDDSPVLGQLWQNALGFLRQARQSCVIDRALLTYGALEYLYLAILPLLVVLVRENGEACGREDSAPLAALILGLPSREPCSPSDAQESADLFGNRLRVEHQLNGVNAHNGVGALVIQTGLGRIRDYIASIDT